MTKNQTNQIVDGLPEAKAVKKNGKEIQMISDLPDSVKKAIDSFKSANEEAKRAAELADINKRVVVDHATELQDRFSEEGQHVKSLRLVGVTSEVTFTRADKFSVAKEATYEEIERIVGKKFASSNFEIERTLQVNPEVMTSPAKLKKLVEILTKALGAELAEYFVQERKVVPKKGLDEAQYTLPADKRKALAELVKQASGGLRG